MLNRKNSGFTLIELIITMAILFIVILLAGQFFVFNIRNYNRGQALSEVQFDVRMASDYVTSELRNVRIISEADVTGSSIINIAKLQERYSTVNGVEFQIIKDNNRILVVYEISGNSDDLNNDFVVRTKVLLNNDSLFKNSFGESTSTLSSIYYIR